jgi:hypothetical protein
VDTIVLENEPSDDEILVDLGWKTQQDKGQWIEEMGIADDAKSLIMIINNIERTEETPVMQEDGTVRQASKKKEVPGNSRLYYYVKDEEDGWKEVFSVNCTTTGGTEEQPSDIYGVYRPSSSFGSLEDPGSLLSYRQITNKDYWITDPSEENFGEIVTAGKNGIETDRSVRLEDLRAFSNYGLILKPEVEDGAYPALVMNCQQSGSMQQPFAGVQLAESYVRMLIQSIDEGTRIMIAGEVEDLGDM